MIIEVENLFNLEIKLNDEEEGPGITAVININQKDYYIELYYDLSIKSIKDEYGYDIDNPGYNYNNMINEEIKDLTRKLKKDDIFFYIYDEILYQYNTYDTITYKDYTITIKEVYIKIGV